MRGDIARRVVHRDLHTGQNTIQRSKLFKYAYDKEIVMYSLSPSSSPLHPPPSFFLRRELQSNDDDDAGMHISRK